VLSFELRKGRDFIDPAINRKETPKPQRRVWGLNIIRKRREI
jgi:hypothetical protein